MVNAQYMLTLQLHWVNNMAETSGILRLLPQKKHDFNTFSSGLLALLLLSFHYSLNYQVKPCLSKVLLKNILLAKSLATGPGP